MRQFKRIALALAASGAISMAPISAHALVKWTMSSGCASPSFGNVCSFASDTSGTGSVQAKAWSNTGTGATLQSAAVQLYSGGGLGVKNQIEGLSALSPQHAMDNDGSMDLLIFDFGATPVTLSEVALGWYQTDSDISVLAWTGSGAPNVDGKLYSETTQGLTSSGWTLIGNYDVDSSDSTNPYRQAISTSVSSSYWLVGAYNSAFGACSAGAGTCQLSPYDDYVKVLELTASNGTPPPAPPPGVPAPASLLLLAGVLPFVRRRKVSVTA